MGTIVTDTYSDQDMQCPGAWENGFKEARITAADVAERSLSDPVTGEWQGSSFRYSLSDYDRRFRAQLASAAHRYWNQPVTVKMTTRENRAVLGTPYTVFNGPIIDAQPTTMGFDITLGDRISQGLLSDEHQIPWRQIKDGFLSQLIEVYEGLDQEAPEPIIYGEHLRVPDVDPPSPQGFIYTPTLLGKTDVAGDAWWIWLVCGHAVADIIDAYTIDPAVGPNPSSILADEGTAWLIPHHAGHTAQFGTSYEDYVSDTYGNTRRYTLVYGKVGEADPDACAQGTLILALAIQGIEPNADGTGAFIQDRLLQYKHFTINYAANFGAASYQSGAWLSNPEWDVMGDGLIPIIEEATWDACADIAALRLPLVVGSPITYPAGYIGAAIIGAHPGDRASVRRWIAEWNRSCGVMFGPNHLGQLRVVMLHPTQAIKDAAPLYEETNDILRASFSTTIGWADQATAVPFVGDYEHATGRWITADTATDTIESANYGRVILGEQREYRFAPGITMLFHLARLEVLRVRHPPRVITLEAPVGPYANGDSLGYLDLGDYLRYRTFEAVTETKSDIRLAQIIKHQVLAGARRVRVHAVDCDDLIGYDTPVLDLPPIADAGSPGSPGPTPGSPFGGFDPDLLVTGPQESITCP